MEKKAKVLIAVILTMAVLLSAGQASALTVWMEGRVTKAPWVENNTNYIEINSIRFSFIKNATIYERTTSVSDIINEEPLALSSIRAGYKVLIAHQGSRIHQIVVLR